MINRKIISIFLIILLASLSTNVFYVGLGAGPKSAYGTVFIDGAIADIGVEVKIVIDGNTFNTTTVEWDEDNYIIDVPPGYEGETGYFYVGDDSVPYDNQTIAIGSETGYDVDLHIILAAPNGYPYKPSTPSPSHGATGISLNPTLSVMVTDPDDDPMNVSFYDSSDDGLIGTDTNVASGGTASVTWSGLGYYTTYGWYAIANDSEFENTSDTWSFTTEEEVNDPPVLSGESPSDGAIGVSVSIPSLSVYIDDLEDDSFDWTIETSPDVGSNNSSGDTDGTKICSVSSLSYSMTYTWYVNATDLSGSGTYTREAYTFTTEPASNDSPAVVSIEDVNISLGGVSAGFVNVTGVSNLGSFSVNLSWDPSVVNVTSIGDSDFTIFNYTNYDVGFVNITGYSMSGVSGDFDIARLEFEAVGSAGDSCDLEIVYSQLLTADPSPSEIDHTRENGTVQIQSTEVTAVVSMDDVDMPEGGSDWGLLMVNNVSNFGSFSVNLSWDPSVVNVTSIVDSDFTIFNYTNYDVGFVNITGYSMSGVSGDFDIARLEFEAVGSAGDSCDLEIVYSQLLTADPSPSEIDHTRINGTACISGNDPPYKPTLVSPSDGSTVSSETSAALEVQVTDPNGDSIDVRFYDASDDSLIGTDDDISNGSTASVTWLGLSSGTAYGWYAVANDSELETMSDTWSFTTRYKPDINLSIEIKSGIGVKALIKNIGGDDATDVEWSISVKNKGLLETIDESIVGTINTLESGGDITAKMLLFRLFARIEINVTAKCEEWSSVSESADGLLIGLFVIIR